MMYGNKVLVINYKKYKYMKKFNKISIVIAVACAVGLIGAVTASALAPGAINLGTAANFAVLAGSL
jgi:hypothetical protein